MTHNISDNVTKEVVLSLCEKIDTPKSLAVYLCLLYDNLSLLEQVRISPQDYLTADSFQIDYFIFSFLSKWKGLDVKLDTKKIATESWKFSESRCAEINKRFEPDAKPVKSGLEAILYSAQMKIANVLGPLDIFACVERGRWGPGATYDMRRLAGLDNKISNIVSVTRSCLKLGRAVIECDPVWFECLSGIRPDGPYSVLDSCFSITRGSRFLTVPKNAKTDRCISAEPTMNGFIQAGAGRYIRERLAKLGVRLDDQSINQSMAQRAFTEHLATLDLRSASDTISRELVMTLLPIDWACFLDDLRSKSTRVDGTWTILEKFSSMGNGFTFELETLIFWALSKSCLEHSNSRDILAVYGDDLIVPSEAATLVTEVLEYCGFELNMEKSFISGSFYESCGRHYFNGSDVTPVYQKNLVNSSAELLRLSNRLVRWSMRWSGAWRCSYVKSAIKFLDKYFLEQYAYRRHIPAIPLGTLGDAGFLRPLRYFSSVDKNHGIYCPVLVFREEHRRASDLPFFAYKLRKPFTTYSYQKNKVVKPTGLGSYVNGFRFINLHEMSEFPADLQIWNLLVSK